MGNDIEGIVNCLNFMFIGSLITTGVYWINRAISAKKWECGSFEKTNPLGATVVTLEGFMFTVPGIVDDEMFEISRNDNGVTYTLKMKDVPVGRWRKLFSTELEICEALKKEIKRKCNLSYGYVWIKDLLPVAFQNVKQERQKKKKQEEKTKMEIKTKFNIGDTVYVNAGPQPWTIEQVSVIKQQDRSDTIRYKLHNVNCDLPITIPEEHLSAEPPKKKTIWNIKVGDTYWVMDTPYGMICSRTWANDEVDLNLRNCGNAFITEEEAEKEVKKRKIETKLKRLAGGYEFKAGTPNYYIYSMLHIADSWSCEIGSYDWIKENHVYFETSEDAQNAIEEIGEERLLRDYFQVID